MKNKCSKCGSDNFEIWDDPINFETNERVSCILQCLDCCHQWWAYFDLAEIQDCEDEE